MGPHRFLTSTLSMGAVAALQIVTAVSVAASADYPPAVWRPAASSNFTVADRTHDYPVDMIVIHSIEGSYNSAITAFQNPARHASAHYVVGSGGQVAQMVNEKDIAWHAGNWDYNTRAIGIEHEGYAYIDGTFTSAMYIASEHLIAHICSRWGVPIDRGHVIGHYQVPDPDNPGLFGGSDHHTDPGPYWHWTNYIKDAHAFADALPSPPVMALDVLALSADSSVNLSWRGARTCHIPIATYDIYREPSHTLIKTVAGNITTATITGLQNGTTYWFSVTARNSDGSDSISSNPVIPMRAPDAPASVSAIAAGGSAIVRWTPPAFNGGGAITGYVVTPYLNGVTPGAPVWFGVFNTLQVVPNLVNEANYTFSVAAINAAGPGATRMSNMVTPRAYLRQPPAQAPPPSSPTPLRIPSQSSPAPTPSGR
jgi:N-acetylmuramoyl-L-alanine amidase